MFRSHAHAKQTVRKSAAATAQHDGRVHVYCTRMRAGRTDRPAARRSLSMRFVGRAELRRLRPAESVNICVLKIGGTDTGTHIGSQKRARDMFAYRNDRDTCDAAIKWGAPAVSAFCAHIFVHSVSVFVYALWPPEWATDQWRQRQTHLPHSVCVHVSVFLCFVFRSAPRPDFIKSVYAL